MLRVENWIEFCYSWNVSNKIKHFIHFINFRSSEVELYLFKCIFWPFVFITMMVFWIRGTVMQIISQQTQTSLRRLQDVLKRSRYLTTKQDVDTASGKRRRIYDVLKTSNLRRLEDVWFTLSWRRPIYDIFRNVWFTTSWRRLIYVVLKTSNLRRLENVWFTTSSGRLIYDVLKTSDLRRLAEVWFMTSWRRL